MIVAVDYASIDGNSPPDWAKFQAACSAAGSVATVAIFRAAWGTRRDETMARDWLRAQQAGLVTGAYLYLRMKDDAGPVDQVHAFADAVGTLRANDLPPILDVEDVGASPEKELEDVHAAWSEVRAIYGIAPILYTSARVWAEDLHNLPAGEMTASPLWLAKPWPWRVHTPAQLAGAPFEGGALDPQVPPPWGDRGNWWLHQYQGDAFRTPGFTSTVDLSRFHVMREGEAGTRVAWVQRRLGLAPTGRYDAEMGKRLRTLQSCSGLAVDGIVGPRTFAALCWTPPAQ